MTTQLHRYPLTYNPILEYWQAIESGTVTVGDKIRRTYKHLAAKCLHPSEVPGESEFFYSPKRGNHAIEFIENFCHHSKGKSGGKPVLLELWEKAFIASVFGFVDIDGLRQYREAMLIIGKKNGKSLLASAIGTYMLVADGEPGPEVYAVATKRDQAKIIWAEAKRMIKKSPALAKRVRCLVNELAADFCDGTFKALASDSNTMDGLNVHAALFDEIHQWINGRELYDIIADGVTAREQPLILITTTAGVIREDLYDEKYEEAERLINGYADPDGYHDPRTICFVYELDNRAEWIDEAAWYKANPGLGTIKNLQTLREKVQRAKANPALVKNLVCKEFNIRETSSEAWLTYEQLDNRETFTLDRENKRLVLHTPQPDGSTVDTVYPYPRYGIGGTDLSSTTDLTAAAFMFMVPGCDKIFCMSMYWQAEDLLEKRINEDKIPYDKWLERGLLRVCPGNKIHHKYVTEWYREIMDDRDIYLEWDGYDSWSAPYWVEDMGQTFGPSAMIPVIQGMKTLSDPMKRLANDLTSKRIVYDNNPITKWCIANTAYKEDQNGNIQPKKTHRPTRRIDGLAAMLDAYTILLTKEAEYMSII